MADSFHGIRLINRYFLACWRELELVGAKHRDLLSLMRRHRHNLRPDRLLVRRNYLGLCLLGAWALISVAATIMWVALRH